MTKLALAAVRGRGGPLRSGGCNDSAPVRDAAPAASSSAPWPASHSTESYLAAIAVGVGLEAAEWARGMAERVDPRGQRDAAIRSAAAVMDGGSISGRAKELDRALIRYIAGDWRRGENALDAPPARATELRRDLWRIVKLHGGGGLGWRRILEIIEN